MARHWIAACVAALILASCGVEEEKRADSGQQQGFSLVSQDSEQLTLRFEISSLYRNITLSGINAACEERLQGSNDLTLINAYRYKKYDYVGSERQCVRRNFLQQCELQQYMHSIDCSYKKR